MFAHDELTFHLSSRRTRGNVEWRIRPAAWWEDPREAGARRRTRAMVDGGFNAYGRGTDASQEQMMEQAPRLTTLVVRGLVVSVKV